MYAAVVVVVVVAATATVGAAVTRTADVRGWHLSRCVLLLFRKNFSRRNCKLLRPGNHSYGTPAAAATATDVTDAAAATATATDATDAAAAAGAATAAATAAAATDAATAAAAATASGATATSQPSPILCDILGAIFIIFFFMYNLSLILLFLINPRVFCLSRICTYI